MLAGDGEALPMIVARQVRALDHEIAQATALRGRLALLMDKFSAGGQPELGEWLESLALMSTFARYFSTDEIRTIVDNWQSVREEWAPLMAAVRDSIDRGVPATDPAVQPLANHWMALIHHWLGGDFDLIERWGRMYLHEPLARQAGAPELAMVRYIERATALRLEAWQRHFTMADLSRFRRIDGSSWRDLAVAAQALMDRGVPVTDPAAGALAGRLHALFEQTVGADPALVRKMAAALAAESLLRAGAQLPPPVQAYLHAAANLTRPDAT